LGETELDKFSGGKLSNEQNLHRPSTTVTFAFLHSMQGKLATKHKQNSIIHHPSSSSSSSIMRTMFDAHSSIVMRPLCSA
jgi:hypothetical protein